MPHIQPELMQRFLADEVDLMEREAIAEHLATCTACADLLVALTAEDDTLSDALRLDESEAEWIASLDLAAPVLQKIRPWYREPGTIISMLLVAGPALWGLNTVAGLLGSRLAIDHPIGFVVETLQALLPALWRLALYLLRGGLLTAIWPVLILAAAYFLWHARTKKEGPENA